MRSWALAALWMLPSLASAQQGAWPVTVACDSGVVPQYQQTLLHVYLAAPLSGDTLEVRRSQSAAAAVTRAFQLRGTLDLPRDVVWTPPVPAAPPAQAQPSGQLSASDQQYSPSRFLPLSGRVTLSVDSTGHAASVYADTVVLVPALRAALLEAVQRADSTGAFGASRGRAITFYVTSSEAPVAGVDLLHRQQVTYLPEQRRTAMTREPRVEYPNEMRASGVEGTVVLRFLVQPDGRVTDAVATRATSAVFAAAAVQALRTAAYTPAQAGGCRVSSLVSQSIVFRMAD